jgi:uncharacterized protein
MSDVTTEPREQHEPSMEEILSSIRRIIADEEADEGASDDDELGAAEAQAEPSQVDDDEAAGEAGGDDDESEDVLELTKVVRDSGEVIDLRAEGSAAAELAHVPESMPEPDSEADEVELAPEDEEPAPIIDDEPNQEGTTAVETKSAASRAGLVSAGAASAATGAFAKLTQAFQTTPSEESVADGSGRSVEQFVEDMIRPMLKDWLDENLPPIVDRLVQKEISKIARRAELM